MKFGWPISKKKFPLHQLLFSKTIRGPDIIHNGCAVLGGGDAEFHHVGFTINSFIVDSDISSISILAK